MDKLLILNRIKDVKNLSSDKELAIFLGITTQSLSNWKSRNTIDYETVFTKCVDVNLNWLLSGVGNKMIHDDSVLREPSATYNLRTDRIETDIQRIPLYNMEAAAGIVQLFRDHNSDQVIDYVQVPGIAKCDGAIYITGDSMYPLLKSGDIVMYKKVTDLSTTIFFWGQMYLLSVDNDGDDFVVVKYIHKSEKGDDYIKLVSQNQHHDPVDIPKSKINALALIKASIRVH